MTTHSHDIDYKNIVTITPQEQSEIEIVGELPYETLEAERSKALQHLGKNIKLDGFRTGHIPEDVLMKQVGEGALLSEMAERALAHHYGHILQAHEIDAIGQPRVEVTKLAPQNPLGFKITVAVVPDITLPDYKSIAREQNKNKQEVTVTDEDVEAQIKDIMRQKAAYERLQAKAAKSEEKTAGDLSDTTELPTPESEAEKAAEQQEPDLNDLTDEYVQTLGQPGQFESVEDFKTKVREHLTIQKTQEAEAAHRAAITEAIVAGAEFALPQVLIESELQQMFAQMRADLEQSGLKFEDYLGHIKKTEEELRSEWKPSAEKRARLQLVLNEIAKVEEVKPDKEKLDEQTKQLMEQYKDADEMRVRVYVASVLINEAVMNMLEEQK